MTSILPPGYAETPQSVTQQQQVPAPWQQRRVGYTAIPKPMYQGLLTGSSTTLYTAPGLNPQGSVHPLAEVRRIVICNTDSSARTITLYVVPSGGSAGDSTSIFKAFSIAANTTLIVPVETLIPAAGTLRGFADTTNKVTLTVSGVELLI